MTKEKLPSLAELRELRALLAAEPDAPLADSWLKLSAFEKIVRFKLLGSERALRFFSLLPLEEQVFLISAADPRTVAPILEATPLAGEEFHVLRPSDVEELLRIAGRNGS